MRGPAAKMSVRQRVREHEILMKGIAEADIIFHAAEARVRQQDATIRRLRWGVALGALASGVVGAIVTWAVTR